MDAKRGDWSASQYLEFANERTRPSIDLLSRVPLLAPATVVDIGCGPGNSTELLVQRWPEANIVGLDSSPDMLKQARIQVPSCKFIEGDIANWAPEAPVDIFFANAVLHWVPHHADQMVRLLKNLKTGGALAVQMPDNLQESSHRLMREVAQENRWAGRLDQIDRLRERILSPAEYYDLLGPLCSGLEIWRTTYSHVLADADAIVEWVKGSGLRPYLDALDTDQRQDFQADYAKRIAAAYPSRHDGKVLLGFPRIFIVGIRG